MPINASLMPGITRTAMITEKMRKILTINSKIHGTPKGVYLVISKLHFILGVENLLAHKNTTINYYVQVNSLRLKSNVASEWASK